jgi:hypothetical protein
MAESMVCAAVPPGLYANDVDITTKILAGIPFFLK